MLIKINGTEIAAYPTEFTVTPLDLDNGDSSVRTSDGYLNRDRVAVKRQIDMSFGLLSWEQTSSILQAMSGVFFDLYYPDPMTGSYVTKNFYVGNRVTAVAVDDNNGIKWSGLKFQLTER